ncbi:MAG: hypothetical protein RIB58_14095 [Phycisphaerales bacterium]
MRHAIVAALAGLAPAVLAAPALGQALEFVWDGTIPLPGETITIGLRASFSPDDYAMAGIATRILSGEGTDGLSGLRLVAPMDGPGTSAGMFSGGNIDGIIAGQLNFPTAGIFADPSNPIAFWEVDYTAPVVVTRPVLVDFQTETSRFDVYVDRDRATSESRLGDLEEASLLIAIPAPAGATVLLGGLAMASTRRRAAGAARP